MPNPEPPRLAIPEVRDARIRAVRNPVRLAAVDLAVIQAQDFAAEASGGVPVRIGVNRVLPAGPVTPQAHGVWDTLPNGGKVWSVQIETPDAEGLSIHFSSLSLPNGARVVVAGADGLGDAYDTSRVKRADGLWTAPVPGPVAFIEYQSPTRADAHEPHIVIDEISHFYRGVTSPVVPAAPGAVGSDVVASPQLLTCHEDVSCWQVDENARDSVGRMTFVVPGQGSFLCTGALLNDSDPNTYAGYFLTAYHCINSSASADSLTVYWFYQTSECGGNPPGLLSRPQSHGAALLAASPTNGGSDSSLLRLYDDPSVGQGFAAWTTTVPAVGAEVAGIHHPGGSYKRYSEGLTTNQSPICGSLPTSRFHYNDWTEGVIEGGSSGSPLFDASWRIVGQLYGVCYFSTPGCNNPQDYNNVYGKLSYFHPQISSYLNAITPDDAYEDNDNLAQAAVLPLGPSDLILVDFDDYFTVVADAAAEITATATFTASQVNLNLELLADGGALLDSSAGTSGTEQVNAAVAPGTYLVRVWRTGDGQGAPYQLDLRVLVEGCQPEAPALAPAAVAKNRYLSIVPGNAGAGTALRVTFDSVHVPNPPNLGGNPPPDLSALNGRSMWVGPPIEFTESETPLTTSYAAPLQCEPHYMDWSAISRVDVYGPEIAPSSTYSVQAAFDTCDADNPDSYSPPLLVTTGRWGDVAPPYQLPAPDSLTQPNVQDISAVVDTVKDTAAALPRTQARLEPALIEPTADISVLEVSRVVDAVLGAAYPFTAAPTCP